MVKKRQLTPLSKKGHVTVNRGKGSVSQRLAPGEQESVSGGSPIDRIRGRFPTNPTPPPSTAGAAPPIGGGPSLPPGVAGVPVEPDADDLGIR